MADEIKWIYEDFNSGPELGKFIGDYKVPRFKVVVQPLWGLITAEMNQCIEFCMQQDLRLSFQVHKYVGWR